MASPFENKVLQHNEMSINIQEAAKEVGKIFKNIYAVSIADEETTMGLSQINDAANVFSKLTVDL